MNQNIVDRFKNGLGEYESDAMLSINLEKSITGKNMGTDTNVKMGNTNLVRVSYRHASKGTISIYDKESGNHILLDPYDNTVQLDGWNDINPDTIVEDAKSYLAHALITVEGVNSSKN